MQFWLKIKRSDGPTMVMAKNPWGVTELEGFDKPTVEIFTEKNAVGDGDTVTGRRVASRLITVKAKNTRPALNTEMRRVAVAFFSPRFTFDVILRFGSTVKRAAGCVIKALAMPIKDVYAPMELSVSLLCPCGYLHGEDNYGHNIAAVTGAFGFPFVSLTDRGFRFSVYNFAKNVHINNDGDAPIDCRAVLRARGVVTNPKLTHGDAYVRMITGMVDGDEIEIDTGARTVTMNGANAVRLLDRESDFAGMRMDVGDNYIGFDAEYGDNALDVVLYYDKNYLSM